ncbi:MAG TPA: radical SAM protein [Clostridia bacterium]|nr:radical SAM protein [Clostridia bacterium]
MKHINVALFVPHEGCPQQCVFCNQRHISGKSRRLCAKDIERAVNAAGINDKKSSDSKREIAFFGGSFTAIDRDYMVDLLQAAQPYIADKRFTGIRISTRPDAVDAEICQLLKQYGVTAIELGAQSMSDDVLAMNRRGHTAQDLVDASTLIKAYGFELGLQMMTGLYGSSPQESITTARKIIACKPKTVRIYPTLVLGGTHLAQLTATGEYRPQTVEEAVPLCAKLLKMFFDEGIDVIRLGLHSGAGVEEGYIAGPYHPAFRELCDAAIYLENARPALQAKLPAGGPATLLVAKTALSQMIGHKRANLAVLAAEGYPCKVTPCEGQAKYQVTVVANE